MKLLVELKARSDKFIAPFKKSVSTAEKFNEVIKTSKESLKKLNHAQKQLDRFKSLTKGTEKVSIQLQHARDNAKRLGHQFEQTDKPSRRLTRNMKRAHAQVSKLEKRFKQGSNSLRELRSRLDSAGHAGATMADRQRSISNATRKTNRQLDKQAKRLERLQKLQRGYNKVKRIAQRGVVIGAAALGLSGTAFSRQESAQIDLNIALLDSSGNTPKQLAKINEIAERLGNKLPGTTADFFKAARSLSEQGVSQDVIANGGLSAASNLAVLLERMPEKAAEMVAKSREAFGLQNNELERMADLTQRTKFAFGLDPESINQANAQMGSRLIGMNLTGIENAKKVLAVEGLSAMASIEGGEFGTSFKNLLKESAFVSENLNKKSFADVKALLDKKGIEFDFFNKDGSFAGIEHMISLLENAGGKLNDQERTQVFTKLFKERGEKVASVLAKVGKKGFNEAIDRINSQASLQQRIDLKTSGFGAHLEALQGSGTSLMAAIFEPLGEAIKPSIRQFNELLGNLTEFVKNGGSGVTVLATLTAGFLSWRSAMLTGRVALGLVSGGLPGATGAFIKHFSWVKKLGGAFKWLGTRSIPLVFTALRGLMAFLIANPIGLTIAAIAVAAWLIYDNWKAVKNGLLQMWDGLTADFQQLLTDFKEKPIRTLATLPQWFFKTGLNMINNLIDGIFGVNIKNKMVQLGQRIKAGLAEGFKGGFKDFMSMINPATQGTSLLTHFIKREKNNKVYNLGNKTPSLDRMIDLAKKPVIATALAGSIASAGVVDTRPSLSIKPANTAQSVVHNNQTFNVYPSPGMNEEALAKKTAEIMKKSSQQSSGGNLYDSPDL